MFIIYEDAGESVNRHSRCCGSYWTGKNKQVIEMAIAETLKQKAFKFTANAAPARMSFTVEGKQYVEGIDIEIPPEIKTRLGIK